jgi:sporulation protein YlmC with PRC-barrel domain
MRRFSKYSFPLLVAGLVLTGRTDEQKPQDQPGSGAPGASQQDKQASEEQREQNRKQQSTFAPEQVSESEMKKSVSEINKASSFIGMKVQNLENEKIGSVNDLVFDPTNGKISYAVLSVGGFLGVGDKLIAVPITSLKARPGANHLVLNMDRNKVESAPGLAQNNWPDLDSTALGGPAGSELETQSDKTAKDQGSAPTSESSSSPQSSSSSVPQSSISSTPGASGSPASSSSGAASQSQSASSTSEQSSESSKDSSATSETKSNVGSNSSIESQQSNSESTTETEKAPEPGTPVEPDSDNSTPKPE